MINCTVNKTKAFVSGAVSIFFGIFGIFYFIHAMWMETIVFLSFFLIFGLVFRENASVLTIDRHNITLSFLGRQRRQMAWHDVKELGLINEFIRKHRNAGKGHRYIYLSSYEMTDSQRLTMVMRWPPKDILYAEYQERLLEFILTLYDKELKTCNIDTEF